MRQSTADPNGRHSMKLLKKDTIKKDNPKLLSLLKIKLEPDQNKNLKISSSTKKLPAKAAMTSREALLKKMESDDLSLG